MGYYVTQQESDFHIKKKNFAAALKILKEAPSNNWSWVDSYALNKSKTLVDAFRELGWETQVDNTTGDISDLHFAGEKLGSEDEWMKIIAPYVEDESYITMTGEDNDIWRWYFRNGKMEVQNAFISWVNWDRIFNAILKHKKILPILLGIDPELDIMIGRSFKEGSKK